jgi:hypothetical protein
VFDPVGAAELSPPPNFLARVEVQNLIRELGIIERHEAIEEEVFYETALDIAEANE